MILFLLQRILMSFIAAFLYKYPTTSLFLIFFIWIIPRSFYVIFI